MRNLFFFFFILGFVHLQGQQLRVQNATTLQPIENVALVNLQHTRTALTDAYGEADISAFRKTDTLFFQHPSYQDLILPVSVFAEMKYVINLKEQHVNLGEIVISASKWEQKREEVPNKISSIKVKDIEYLNPQTTADLIETSNEVFIQKSQLGGGSPMIRGFSANSILLVIDGVRMNNAIYRSGNLQNIITIDPNMIENAEIIFGPGSIIYGSDALGGVMDLHTREVLFSSNKKSQAHGRIVSRYSSANNEKTIHADLEYGRRKWGFVTSFSRSDFDDLKMGSRGNDDYRRLSFADHTPNGDVQLTNTEPNIQKFSGYNQSNFLQKIAFRPDSFSILSYNFHYSSSSDIPRYDRLIQTTDENQLKYAQWYYGPQKWMMHSLELELKKPRMLYSGMRLIAAYQQVEESRNDRKFGKDDLRSRTETVDVYSLNLDFDKKLSPHSTLFYGLEGVYNKVGSEGYKQNIYSGAIAPVATRYPDGGSNYSTVAWYANFKTNLSKKFTLQAGIRMSQVIANGQFEDTSFYHLPFTSIELNTGALNGSLGLVFRPGRNSQINMNVSSGFRAPNIDDLAKVFDSEPGSVVVPNAGLNPEYAYNVDLGIISNIDDWFHFEVTGFYTLIGAVIVRRDFSFNGQDSIVYDGELSKVQAMQNLGSGWIAGGSAALKAYLTPGLVFYSNLTYIKGKDDAGDALRHVAPMYGSSGFTYTRQQLKFTISAQYNGNIKSENLAPDEQRKSYMYASDNQGRPYSPGWLTFDMKANYRITKNIDINLGLENLMDLRYRPYSSGIVAPGRNFVMALRAGF